jgi:hypothetical protein
MNPGGLGMRPGIILLREGTDTSQVSGLCCKIHISAWREFSSPRAAVIFPLTITSLHRENLN